MFPTLARTEYVLPTLEIVERFGGLNHSNTTGRLAALPRLVMILGCQQVTPWRDLYAYFVGFAVCLYFTDSRTTMIATAAVALLHIVRDAPACAGTLSFGRTVVAVMAAIGVGSGAIDADAVVSRFVRMGEAQELYTLHRRLRCLGIGGRGNRR